MPILGSSSSGAKAMPSTPIIGAANASGGSVTVSFTPSSFSKLPITSYTVTSSSGATATGVDRKSTRLNSSH